VRTRWLVSQTPPNSFRFLDPPDPPDVPETDGGTSGMVSVSSAPELTTVLITSDCWRAGTDALSAVGAAIEAI
jgi:hypothetical protein